MTDSMNAVRPDVATVQAALTAHGVDSAPAGDSDVVDGARPLIVARPRDESEVAEALGASSSCGARVLPRGGGTWLDLGRAPSDIEVVVDTTAMSGIVEHEPADLTATVRAGTRLADLQRDLARSGQYLPLDPPQPEQATIGGIIATAASGPFVQRYGPVRDQLIGIRIAGANGTVTHAGGKVVKNVAGYDLCKLYTGSMGTLGIITEAAFKLAPLPDTRRTVISRFGSVEQALAATRALARNGTRPLAMDVLSARAASLCGVDSPGSTAAVALILLGGNAPTVRREVDDVTAGCGHANSEVLADDDGQDSTWGSVRSLSVGEAHDRVIVLRASAALTALPEAWSALAEALAGDATTIWARAGHGVVYAVGLARDDDASQAAAIERARERIASHGGSLVVERGPLSVKARVDPWGQALAATRIMVAVKRRLDPGNILSPGRFAGV